MTKPEYVGCCGWTQAQSQYFLTFPTIEIQTTFYQPPAVSVAQRWKSKAPAGFRFCMKAWQLITHTPTSPTYRRLKAGISAQERELYGSFRPTEQVALAWERTREIADAIDAEIIVFQCPKSFLPIPENLRNLGAFFRGLDRSGRQLAWEPRGADWPEGLVRDICTENDLLHCVDPFLNDSVFGGTTYWRLHGRNGYRYRYSDQDLQELTEKLDRRRPYADSHYVLFNNMFSHQDALRFVSRQCG